jgi:hypothetical protein
MNLLLWGAGGHAKVVLDCAAATRMFQSIVFIDDAPMNEFCGRPILGDRTLLAAAFCQGYTQILVSIGDNLIRAACFALAQEHGMTGAMLPILALSPMLQTLAGLRDAIGFPGDVYVLFGFSSAVFWYGGWPFLKGFFGELKSRQVGMMTLTSIRSTI